MEKVPENTTPPRSTRAELKTLLDEVKVRVHLGAMDVRQAFHEIAREAEKLGREVGHEAERRVQGLIVRLRSIRDSIVHGGN